VAPIRRSYFRPFPASNWANTARNYRVLIMPNRPLEGVEAALDTVGRIILSLTANRARILRERGQNKKSFLRRSPKI